MTRNSLIQVRVETEIKEKVEQLYEELGTSLSEVVRMMIVQSLIVQGIPFEVSQSSKPQKKLMAMGIAHKYADVTKIPTEKDAWKLAAMRKHENS